MRLGGLLLRLRVGGFMVMMAMVRMVMVRVVVVMVMMVVVMVLRALMLAAADIGRRRFGAHAALHQPPHRLLPLLVHIDARYGRMDAVATIRAGMVLRVMDTCG